MKAKNLITCAMLTAMYVVLSLISLNFANLKITLDSLPIIVGALLLGPGAGSLVGLLGSFLNQLLTYGLTPTTLLWMAPAAARGLIVGLYAKQKRFDLTRKNLIFILVVSSLAVTTLNTAVIYLDSVIYGYYSFAYVFGTLVIRYITGIATAVVLAGIVPPLMKPLKKALSIKQ